MSVNKDDTLRQFCDVTGADENRSKFFLESANWQLEVALSSFYEHGGNVDEAPTYPVAAPSVPVIDSDMESPPRSPIHSKKDKEKKKKTDTKFATLNSLLADSSSDDEGVSIHGWISTEMKLIVQEFFCDNKSCSRSNNKGNSTRSASNSFDSAHSELSENSQEVNRLQSEVHRLLRENYELRREIARLTDLNEREHRLGNMNMSEEIGMSDATLEVNEARNGSTHIGEGEAFYAGGSERSGQQILGPGKGRKDIVTEMFTSVRERGAVVFEDEPSSTRGRQRALFGGTGYRLGQTADDHEQVTPSNSQDQPQSRSVRLRLYREGFTVDGGELRPYTTPENAEFLSCIRMGEIPPELANSGGEVRVSLEDHRLEECPRHTAKTSAFAGKGHMLGSPTPPTVGATAPIAADAHDRAANQRSAQEAVGLDETQPITTVQFRLADGSRLTGRFNHSHTVGDLHQYVARAEPTYQLQAFILLTTFPSAELTDQALTLVDAKLLNTTVLQRLK